MEQVYRIRNMKKFEGKSLRKISQLTGHDFETVKKYVEKDDFNQILRPKQRRKSKLSPYRGIVTTWLIKDKQAPHKQRHTAKRVYDRLKELYGGEFDTSERAVRKFVADIRKELQSNIDGFLLLEHSPGEAQADFGEAQFIENGINMTNLLDSPILTVMAVTQLSKSIRNACWKDEKQYLNNRWRTDS